MGGTGVVFLLLFGSGKSLNVKFLLGFGISFISISLQTQMSPDHMVIVYLFISLLIFPNRVGNLWFFTAIFPLNKSLAIVCPTILKVPEIRNRGLNGGMPLLADGAKWKGIAF